MNRSSYTAVISFGCVQKDQQCLHSHLTWALGEVVKAAVPGPDAPVVAVACAIHAVHPPVGGGAARVSASATFSRATPRHQMVPPQSGNHQQQTGQVHRGAHDERVTRRSSQKLIDSVGDLYRLCIGLEIILLRGYATLLMMVRG